LAFQEDKFQVFHKDLKPDLVNRFILGLMQAEGLTFFIAHEIMIKNHAVGFLSISLDDESINYSGNMLAIQAELKNAAAQIQNILK